MAAFGLAPFAVSSSAAAFARSAGPTAAGGIGALAFPLSAVFPPLVALGLAVAFSLTGLLGFQFFAPAFPFSGAGRSLGLFLDTLRGEEPGEGRAMVKGLPRTGCPRLTTTESQISVAKQDGC